MNAPRHPGIESTLTLNDVAAGVAYVTYIPGQRVIERGTFTSEPDYSEADRWTATARIVTGVREIVERQVCLHAAGISVDYNGEGWAEAVTVADSE